MKTRNVLVLVFSLVMFTNCFAQKDNKKNKKEKETAATEIVAPAETAAQPGLTPEALEECRVNISLFNESAKNKQYADALGPWNAAYAQCPGENKVIYSRGRDIVQWELLQTKDAASYQKVFEKLMGMYDSRIKYFSLLHDDQNGSCYTDCKTGRKDDTRAFGHLHRNLAGGHLCEKSRNDAEHDIDRG